MIITIMEKIQLGQTLNEQEQYFAHIPFYKLMGYDSPEDYSRAIKNRSFKPCSYNKNT